MKLKTRTQREWFTTGLLAVLGCISIAAGQTTAGLILFVGGVLVTTL